MKFKGVEHNSVIREIGSLFRRHDGSDWHINVKLAPGQKKQYFGISQIPILARRRVFNASELPRPAGFQSRIVIENTRHWRTEPNEACPIPVVNRQDDGQQWCFNFEFGGTQYYLPQLELARVLFFHHAYITRLALISGGLSQEFDVQRLDKLSKALVNILPTCTLPLYVRGDYALRRLLAWILLDDEARLSFESIARYQLQNGYDTDKYRLWRFQFEPPPLAGVELTLRGHYDQERKAFFVYEIYGVSNLTCHCPAYVDFVDPRFAERRSGQGRAVRPGSQSGPELEIDDEQEPDSDHTEIRIETPAVAFEFVNPIQTTRIGKGKAQTGRLGQDGDSSDVPENTGFEVSTDEASTYGTLASADYDGVEDKSDDAHLYTDKFEAFNAMVLQLVGMSGCRHTHREIRKLLAIDGYSKHLLVDGNPRCLAFHRIKKDGQEYALIEVDTSDNKNKLSTLLLKQQDMSFDWEKTIKELEIRLLKGSLSWPTPFIQKGFGRNYKRISHPKTASESKNLLDSESITRWAERVYLDITRV
jgi:hypothetical protein